MDIGSREQLIRSRYAVFRKYFRQRFARYVQKHADRVAFEYFIYRIYERGQVVILFGIGRGYLCVRTRHRHGKSAAERRAAQLADAFAEGIFKRHVAQRYIRFRKVFKDPVDIDRCRKTLGIGAEFLHYPAEVYRKYSRDYPGYACALLRAGTFRLPRRVVNQPADGACQLRYITVYLYPVVARSENMGQVDICRTVTLAAVHIIRVGCKIYLVFVVQAERKPRLKL